MRIYGERDISEDRRRIGRRSALTAVLAAGAVVVAVSGCGSDTSGTAAPEGGDITETGAATHEHGATPSPRPEQGEATGHATTAAAPTETGAGDDCSVPGGEPTAIANAVAAIPPPMSGVSWQAAESTLDGCSDLSYVVLETEGATVSSPWQLLLFHRGEFQGTGTRCNLGYQTVTGSGGDHVDVTYRYLVGEEPNAAPQGSVDITYRWNGSGVEMVGALPEEVTRGQC